MGRLSLSLVIKILIFEATSCMYPMSVLLGSPDFSPTVSLSVSFEFSKCSAIIYLVLGHFLQRILEKKHERNTLLRVIPTMTCWVRAVRWGSDEGWYQLLWGFVIPTCHVGSNCLNAYNFPKCFVETSQISLAQDGSPSYPYSTISDHKITCFKFENCCLPNIYIYLIPNTFHPVGLLEILIFLPPPPTVSAKTSWSLNGEGTWSFCLDTRRTTRSGASKPGGAKPGGSVWERCWTTWFLEDQYQVGSAQASGVVGPRDPFMAGLTSWLWSMGGWSLGSS